MQPYTNYGSIEDMGSPPGEKSKRCSPCLLATLVVLLIILALAVGALISFFVTRNLYGSRADDSNERRGKNQLTPIDHMLLPTSLVPNSYELSVKAYIPGYDAQIPAEKNLTFEGQVIIDIEVKKEVRKITLNGKNLSNINATCTADGKALKVESITLFPDLEKIYFVLNTTITPKQKILLTIHYTGEINTDLGGIYQTRYTNAEGKQRIAAVTQMQPMSARKLVPCFDEPEYKANWTVTVMHPKGTKAISNGIENGNSSDLNEDFLVSHFETTPKMSSYLLAIFISEFQFIEGKTATGLRFRVWSRPEQTNMTKYALSAGIKCLEYYEEYYKIPFPLKKQDMIALPDFAAGAMENWGMITYRENALLYDEKLYKPSEKLRVATVIAHELGHQWFGNLVTMKWWNDLWLNEGFATLTEYMGADQISSGHFRMKDYFLVDAMTDAWRDDSTASGHPLTHKIQYPTEIDESFDGITYQKGAAVLNMIKMIMGPENFQKGIHAYLQKHQYSNTTSTDLMVSLSEAVRDIEGPKGGQLNVTEFAQKWTHQMGYPYIYLDELNSTHLKITQKRFKLNPETKDREKFAHPKYGFTWDVPVWIQTGKNAPVMKWLPANGTLHILKEDGPIILNAEGYAFIRSNYNKELWSRIFDQLKKDHTVFSERTRFGIISDAFSMAEIGQLSYEHVFELLDYIGKETEYMPWSSFRMQFGIMMNYFGSEPSSKLAEKLFAKVLEVPFSKTNVEQVSTNYLNEEKFFQNLHDSSTYINYCDANRPACRKDLMQLYETKVAANCKGPNAIFSQCSTVAAPLRAIVYCRAVEEGDETQYDRFMEVYKNERVQIERIKIMEALACSKSNRILKTLLDLAVNKTSNTFRSQDVSALFSAVARNENGGEIAFNFLLDRWDDLLKSFGEQPDIMIRIVSSICSTIRSKSQIEQLKSFRKNATNGLRYQALYVQATHAEHRLKWLEKNGATLEKLFKERL